MSHPLFARLLLIIALLFTQMGGYTHGISHALADKGSDHSLTHDKQCELCAAYAQIGSAIGSSAAQFVHGDSYETPHHSLLTLPASITFVAYTARAPPYSA